MFLHKGVTVVDPGRHYVRYWTVTKKLGLEFCQPLDESEDRCRVIYRILARHRDRESLLKCVDDSALNLFSLDSGILS